MPFLIIASRFCFLVFSMAGWLARLFVKESKKGLALPWALFLKKRAVKKSMAFGFGSFCAPLQISGSFHLHSPFGFCVFTLGSLTFLPFLIIAFRFCF